jgi:hypothetical protein
MVEDGRVKFLLSSEMPEDHSLRNARHLSDFFGGGTAKAPLRKKTNRYLEDLQSPILGGHSRSACNFVRCRVHAFSDCYFFTQESRSSLMFYPK